MPSPDRDASSRDRELVRHQPAQSESHRLSVPMWDSSDPERAPPPLPLNPRSMSPATKSNVSPNIQAVAAKFADKPSENAPSSYTTNAMPNKSSSPERSLVKGHYHKRMQSMPSGETKGDARSEFLNYLENRSPERPLRATILDPTSKPLDPIKPPTSPLNRPQTEREIPSYISSRHLSKPILGESTPPSATMLALQNMQLPSDNDPPSPSKPPKMIEAPREQHQPTHTMDTLASQIHSLTDIASNLQREMSNLSRRSKDNATDLVSLKAATNARDEDIRKSLKDLSSNLATKLLDGEATRFDLSAFLKPRDGPNPDDPDSSPNSKRSYSVPRMPSPNPFGSLDRDLCGSPAPISDGSASIALLEKVLREMATKEGEERLLELVDEIKSRPAANPSAKDADNKITNMLEEILNLVKEDPSSRALVRSLNSVTKDGAKDGNLEGMRSTSTGSFDPTAAVRALDVSKADKAGQPIPTSDEVLSILRSVKNSVVESGGMTNGVKALVRELRGEVLGMGRDLARKLEEVESTRGIDQQQQAPGLDEISSIVNNSLHDLREQLAATVTESREHSSAFAQYQSTMNSAAIYSVVKRALDEFELPQPQEDSRGAGMEKEDILETVREAWETYKPEIELQNFGLERDEILDCLSEGLKSYQPQHEQALTYDQVLSAVETGMKNFAPPPSEQPPSITRDEIILTIRECLEKPESASRALEDDQVSHFNSIRDDILGAVSTVKSDSSSRGIDEEHSNLLYSVRDEILHALSERNEHAHGSFDERHSNLLHSIRDEILDAVTAEKQADASRSMDEGQAHHLTAIRDEILDAVTRSVATQSMVSKESFDSGLGRDDIVSAISDGLEAHFTTAKEMEEPRISKADVVTAINDAFNSQQSALSTSTETSVSREEIMNAIVDGIEAANQSRESAVTVKDEPSISREEILATIAEGLEKSQESDKSALAANIPPAITRDEVFSAIVDGLESANTMTREIELNKDDLLEAITAGLHDATNSANLNVGDQVLERLQDVVDGMKEEFKQYSAANGKDTEQVLDAVKDGLDVVRKEIESYVITAQDVSGKHEIIDTVKEGFRLLQADMEKTITDTSLSNPSRGNPDTPELLDAMEKEFEHLRGTISTLLLQHNTTGDKDEILDAVREVSEQQKTAAGDEQVVKTIQAEFEKLRERMDMTVARAEPGAEKDEIIFALREHFDNLREETLQYKDGNESMLSATSELLDAFNEGIDSIRNDLKKALEKPAEFDGSEIMDTIKGGLAELKVDIESIRQSQKDETAEDVGTARGALITQLQDKVESIETTPRAAEPSEDSLKREHLDEVLLALQDVQVAVGEMGASREPPEDVARKEHTDAIENLLMSTKAQIDDLVFPAPDEIATSEQIGALESMIREAKDTLAGLSSRLEAEAPTKSDIGTLEGLIKDIWVALDEMKGKATEGEENAETDENSDKLRKSDLQTVEAMVFEVKSQIDELKLPDVETLPTKDEIKELSLLVTDFRDKMESNNELTAQGFEARKVEHGGLAEKIDEAKLVFGELGEELKSKLDGSNEGLTELKQLLEGLAITAENFSTVESVKELTDLINREFERARGEVDAGKIDKEERDAAAMVKHDETRAAIIVELGAKIDEKIGEVLGKYEDANASLHSKFSETEERDMAHTEAVTSTKSLAEDIKLVIGAMGNNVNETCERLSEETKTFFGKVDESYNRMEEMHNEVKSHQEQTRGDNERATAATERVESKLLEFHPQILETVQEILSVVSQHYEHSQKSTEEVRNELSSLPSAIPTMLPALPPPESTRDLADTDTVHTKLNDILDHAKNNQFQDVLSTLLDHSKNDQLHEKLDRALDEGTRPDDQVYDKLNQLLDHATNGKGPIHEKLDALLNRPANAVDPEQSVTQMMKLDEMHKDIMENSRKMNEMFAAQSVVVAQETERKRREAEEAGIALERRIAQREQVEAEIVGLHEEKDSLLKMIHTLKTEKEDLAKQNTKLSKEVSGLEMALEIRHEEMQQMEDRADGLEKRILEGVLDHARTVLLSRNNSLQSMNLKRNRSARTSRTGARSPSATSAASVPRDNKDSRSLLGNGVGMALKRRGTNALPAGPASVQPNIGKERRILSLSHVTGNRGADRQTSTNSGITNLKRSHSVKSNFSLRKSSWGGRLSVANKENEAFPEEEEPESEGETDAGTERKTSYAGTDRRTSYAGTERKLSYAETCTDSMFTGGSESVVSNDRRTSGVSTRDGHADAAESSIVDDDHATEQHDGSEQASDSDDDAQPARESGDEEEEEKEEKNADEAHGDVEKRIAETAETVEAEVMKLLGPPPSDSGLVSAARIGRRSGDRPNGSSSLRHRRGRVLRSCDFALDHFYSSTAAGTLPPESHHYISPAFPSFPHLGDKLLEVPPTMLDPLGPPPAWLRSATEPYALWVNSPTLSEHIHEVILAFVFYQFIHSFLSPWLSPILFPQSYPKLNARTKLNWDIHVVSLVQSVLINAAALWVMYVDTERNSMSSGERVFGYTGACGLIQALAVGYFVYDLIVSAVHLQMFGVGMLFHAISALWVFSLGFRPFLNYYAPVFILYELSSPFLNIHWFLDKVNMTGSRAQWYNGMALLAVFFCCRLLWGTWQSAIVYKDMWFALKQTWSASSSPLQDPVSINAQVFQTARGGSMCIDEACARANAEISRFKDYTANGVPTWLVGTYVVSNLILNFLNYFWFGKMVETVLKRFRTPNPAAGAEKPSEKQAAGQRPEDLAHEIILEAAAQLEQEESALLQGEPLREQISTGTDLSQVEELRKRRAELTAEVPLPGS
ncbi:hypothetical protein N7492_004785 [Penicillium capsulatum]|uniref:TLC domain-containing protein n=1 Tax=Penicillium capsulatum TaxID=69766 RepID=A0A9W9IC77_9EURO|nr:hypothetical protein N7492_004785 [Penicillium capsulatum]KAJ6136108.1 hypothetical protein N7512_001268 [Penicillium capsulatum]